MNGIVSKNAPNAPASKPTRIQPIFIKFGKRYKKAVVARKVNARNPNAPANDFDLSHGILPKDGQRQACHALPTSEAAESPMHRAIIPNTNAVLEKKIKEINIPRKK